MFADDKNIGRLTFRTGDMVNILGMDIDSMNPPEVIEQGGLKAVLDLSLISERMSELGMSGAGETAREVMGLEPTYISSDDMRNFMHSDERMSKQEKLWSEMNELEDKPELTPKEELRLNDLRYWLDV